MPYLGNTPEQQAFTPAVDYFSGNGSTTAFTLSRPVASTAQIQVTVENVPQAPGTAYTVSGNTITFDGAPPSGTNNIYVYYTSPITQVIQPGQGTVGTAQIQNGAVIPADLSTGGPYWDTSGNVGIGTSSPISGFKLDVQGADFRVGDDANQGFEAGYSAGGVQAFAQGYNRGTSAFIDMQISAATLKFGTGSGATERFRIGPSGQIGIGGANYGTSGQVLTSAGSGSAPSWSDVSVTTSAVLSATAGASVGAVGTYAFMTTLGTGTLNPGDTVAGSGLRYCNAVVGAAVNNSDAYTTTTGSGTWRCMGYTRPFYNCSASLFLRIS